MNGALISFLCAHFIIAPGNYGEACSKGFEAASIQTGVKTDLEKTENYFRHVAEKNVPQQVTPYAAIAVAAATQSVQTSMGVPFLRAQLSLRVSPETQTFSLIWHF